MLEIRLFPFLAKRKQQQVARVFFCQRVFIAPSLLIISVQRKKDARSRVAHAFLKEGGDANDFYDIHKITGDGRCLFRSLVVSKSLEDENTRLSAEREVLEADYPERTNDSRVSKEKRGIRMDH